MRYDGDGSGRGLSRWHYLPTIAFGEEQTTYHAVDVLRARSADAPISGQLGATSIGRPCARIGRACRILGLGVERIRAVASPTGRACGHALALASPTRHFPSRTLSARTFATTAPTYTG